MKPLVVVFIIAVYCATQTSAQLPPYCSVDVTLGTLIWDVLRICTQSFVSENCNKLMKQCHDYQPNDCCKCFYSDVYKLKCRSC